MLLCVVEQPAGKQDGLLPLGEAAHDGVRPARRRVREHQAARRHSGADAVDAQLRAGLQRVVIGRVFKRQRQDAGVECWEACIFLFTRIRIMEKPFFKHVMV